MERSKLDLKAGNDTCIKCFGKTELQFALLHYLKTYEHEFYICTDDTMPILGMDFLTQHDTCIDLARNEFSIDGVFLDVEVASAFA